MEIIIETCVYSYVMKVLFKLIKATNNKNEIFIYVSNQPIGLLKIISILDKVIKEGLG